MLVLCNQTTYLSFTDLFNTFFLEIQQLGFITLEP